MLSNEFIKKIPKTDLHVHLDGSLRIPTLIELAKKEISAIGLVQYDKVEDGTVIRMPKAYPVYDISIHLIFL